MGRTKPGGGKGAKPKAILEWEKELGEQIPPFLAISNLKTFLSNELRSGASTVFYIHPKKGFSWKR